jgi:hypothetical protein
VIEAAVIGVAIPKWDERPLLIVVKRDGAPSTRDELLRFYDGKVAKWCIPTTSCSSTSFRTRRRASCRRRRCGNGSGNIALRFHATRTSPCTYHSRHDRTSRRPGLLRAFGITTIFGNPGSTELALFRDFPRDFRYILGLQEAVVVGMADGYAQATRNAAFVNLHSAVGVGHAMGNIFTAYRNRTPIVITAGQQARSILPYEPFLYSSQATELPSPT